LAIQIEEQMKCKLQGPVEILLWNYHKHRLGEYLVNVESISQDIFGQGIHSLIEHAVDARGRPMAVEDAVLVLAKWLVRERVIVLKSC